MINATTLPHALTLIYSESILRGRVLNAAKDVCEEKKWRRQATQRNLAATDSKHLQILALNLFYSPFLTPLSPLQSLPPIQITTAEVTASPPVRSIDCALRPRASLLRILDSLWRYQASDIRPHAHAPALPFLSFHNTSPQKGRFSFKELLKAGLFGPEACGPALRVSRGLLLPTPLEVGYFIPASRRSTKELVSQRVTSEAWPPGGYVRRNAWSWRRDKEPRGQEAGRPSPGSQSAPSGTALGWRGAESVVTALAAASAAGSSWVGDWTEKAMARHSSTRPGKVPWMEDLGRLQSTGSLGVGHDWETSLSLFTFMLWRRKWQPTPVFLPGESQGRGSLVGCHLWGRTESDRTEAT